MGTVKRKATPVEEFEEPITKVKKAATPVNDWGEEVIVEPIKKKESIADIGSAGSSVSSKTSDSIKEISPGVSATGESAGVMPGVQHSLGEESYLEEGGGIGSALKLAGAPPKKYEAPSIEEFNKKFESFTGRKEIDLGSDLPQIKKQKEQKKYEQYRAEETVLNETIKKINSGDATMVDFIKVNKISPKVLNEVKNSVGISVLKDDIPEGENKEDSYLWRVYAGYKDKVFDQRLSYGRQRREELGDRIKENIPAVSRLTGYEYTVPTSLDDAKKILADINAKKAEFAAFTEAATKNFINVAPEQTKAAIGAISEADKIMPSLIQSVKGFVFDEESKKNPSVTPFEVGKKVLEIIDPDVYAIYMNAGGDKTYREGVYGQGISDTPKKADAVNRRILELGVDAFNTFGNKAAIAKADESSKSLRWKFTKPIEEETKHMIAASLMQSGVNPSKATDEQKDAIADTLPELNREVWFNNNKTENNTQLPNTGFRYSFGNMYRHIVEDAAKTLLGGMIPEKTREQALDALEEQGMSKTIGENPESKARLDQLVRKEKSGPLTDEEMAEKEMLSKFTNTRNWWQKFKDLSGGATGQFAGLGTISAFTGGVSNTKNTLGAVKSLIAPNAGKKGMLIAGYLMSREANAREAASLFPGKNEGIKRFVYGELASVIDTFVERIFPEEKFLNTSVVKKDLAKIIPGINANNIRQYLTEGFAEKFAKTAIKKIADWQKTPLQEGAEEMLSAYLKDTVNGIMDPGADAISMDELVNIGTQAYLGTQLLGVPKGVMAQRNKYVPINAIWDAASDKNTYFDVRYTIEEMRHRKELSDSEANEKISMLNTARKLWEDSPVLSGQIGNLSDRQRQNYLVRQLDELALKKKADETADENVKAEYNRLISESKEIRKKIFNDEMFVTDRNDEVEVKQMTPVQVIQQQAEKGLLAGGYSELIKENPALAEDVLLDYAKQKYGLTDKGQELDMGGRQIDNKEVDAAVTRAFPDKQSVQSYLSEKESVAKVNVRSREIGEAVMPILERVNNADYINEGELDTAANSLYELMDEVENSEMSDEQKQSSLNLIEPIITKLEGYEFRTKTESGETTEVKATVVPRQISKKSSAPALEQSTGSEVEITLPDGGKRKGRLGIKSGSYVVDVPKGQQVVLGEKAITDRDLSLPDEQEMENPIEFDDDGNVASITFKTKSGNLVKIKDSEVALDLAIQLKADMIGDVPQSDFDIALEEVKKPYTREVLVLEDKKQPTQTSTAQTKAPQPVQEGNEGASVQKSAKQIESLKAEKQSKIKDATRLSVAVEELDADSIPDDISSSVMSKESKKYERAKAEMKKLKELADCIWG